MAPGCSFSSMASNSLATVSNHCKACGEDARSPTFLHSVGLEMATAGPVLLTPSWLWVLLASLEPEPGWQVR